MLFVVHLVIYQIFNTLLLCLSGYLPPIISLLCHFQSHSQLEVYAIFLSLVGHISDIAPNVSLVRLYQASNSYTVLSPIPCTLQYINISFSIRFTFPVEVFLIYNLCNISSSNCLLSSCNYSVFFFKPLFLNHFHVSSSLPSSVAV